MFGWWWFVFWVLVVFLILSGGSWYGYRRSYYSARGVISIFIVLMICFIIAVVWIGPYWGWYGRWW